MKLRILKQVRPRQIESLVSGYGLHDYRRYRMLKQKQVEAYVCFQIRRLLVGKGAWIVAAGNGGRLLGLATLQRLDWDTQCLGIPTAKIGSCMVAPGGLPGRAVQDELLAFLLRLAREEGIALLSWRVDTDDMNAASAAQKHGFRLADTLVTYVFNRFRHSIPALKDLFHIRSTAAQDASCLAAIAARAFSKDHFHADHRLSAQRADALFAEWIKNACRQKRLNRVLVAEGRGGIAGFLTFALNPDLARFCGYRIAGHGLSAVAPEGKGAYPCLVKAALEEIVRKHDCLEFDTQLNNYEVLRVWQNFGFDFVRSKYTFHRWLRPAAHE